MKKFISGLYVPGSSDKMLLKACGVPASVIVPDMEDSVPLTGKTEARERILGLLPEMKKESKSMIFP